MKRLLVVDDDQPLARSLVQVFRSTYAVVAVFRADDAIRAINSAEPPIELVVTDYDLSEPQTGMDVIKAAAIRGIPCLLYSSTEGLTYQPRLAKPANPDELLAAVQRLTKENPDVESHVPGMPT